MRDKSMGTHLENVDAMPCNGSSLLAEEMVYLLQVGVDGIIVVIICRKRLGWRESQEDGHGIVHGELCECGCGCGGYLWRREAAEEATGAVDKLSQVVGGGDDDDDGGQTRLPS